MPELSPPPGPPPGLAPGTRALGYAGLLPQAAALGGLVAVRLIPDAWPLVPLLLTVAVAYPALILSFLGGIWWGIALRIGGSAQVRLGAAAVGPSLVALALVIGLGLTERFDWALIALGSALLLTLPVDRRLERRGLVPPGWLRFRTVLSGGLGGLTIAAGMLLALAAR